MQISLSSSVPSRLLSKRVSSMYGDSNCSQLGLEAGASHWALRSIRRRGALPSPGWIICRIAEHGFRTPYAHRCTPLLLDMSKMTTLLKITEGCSVCTFIGFRIVTLPNVAGKKRGIVTTTKEPLLLCDHMKGSFECRVVVILRSLSYLSSKWCMSTVIARTDLHAEWGSWSLHLC